MDGLVTEMGQIAKTIYHNLLRKQSLVNTCECWCVVISRHEIEIIQL